MTRRCVDCGCTMSMVYTQDGSQRIVYRFCVQCDGLSKCGYIPGDGKNIVWYVCRKQGHIPSFNEETVGNV